MNTNCIHQIRTATFSSIVAFIACASTAAPALAGEVYGERGSGTNSVSPYAVSITALDGLALAQYIQKHQNGNPHTATLV